MKRLPFTKMHGLGNDFIIIEKPLPESIKDIKSFIINISNRQTGVGCDQFITYKKQNNLIEMGIFNHDGSTAKACGNASRCLGRLIFDKYNIRNIVIRIGDKEIESVYSGPDNITVNMGKASFNAGWMPKKEEIWQLAEKYMVEPKETMCVDVGNPHLVIFTQLTSKDQKIIIKSLQKHDLFPGGVNINFARIVDDAISLKVWERGTGFTLACGSGAAASFAVASKLGFVGKEASVHFELGALKMRQEGGQLLMTGPAEYVFTGEYYYE